MPNHKIETFKSVKAATEYLKKLHKIQTKEFQTKQMQTLINNIINRAEAFDNPELKRKLKSLTAEQLDELYSKSDFIEQMFIDTPPRRNKQYSNEPVEQSMIMKDQDEYLLELINKLENY